MEKIKFDQISKWKSFKLGEYDLEGWEGIIFLEDPVPTSPSAYPYSVKAKIYHYNPKGELEHISEGYCGLNGCERRNEEIPD
jgi:hypothetical protein